MALLHVKDSCGLLVPILLGPCSNVQIVCVYALEGLPHRLAW